MLIWVPDEEGKRILPRSINPRRKMAIEAEISCSNIFEIASSTAESGPWRRDENLNVESSRKVVERMEEAGVTTPNGRQLLEVESRQDQSSEDDLFIHREWKVELQQLEDRLATGDISKYVGGVEKVGFAVSPEWKRWKHLKTYKESKKSIGKELSAKLTAELEGLDSRVAAGTLKRYRDPELNTSQMEVGPQRKTVLRDKSSLPKTSEYKRLMYLRQRLSADRLRTARSGPLFAEFDIIMDLQTKIKTLEGTEAEALQQEIHERTAAFNEQLEVLPAGDSEAFRLRLDDRRTFKNDPPLLYWDRREAEPLKVNSEEFFPRHELCLLDFHPAPLWDVLKQDFPASYDVFEYILATLFIIPTQSVKAGLTALSPGAFEWLVAECPSLTDISKGGSPDLDFMAVRCLTLEMLKEITEAWMRWPFRPHRYELMRKLGSAVYDPDEESVGQQQSISEK
jgi:transcription factor 1